MPRFCTDTSLHDKQCYVKSAKKRLTGPIRRPFPGLPGAATGYPHDFPRLWSQNAHVSCRFGSCLETHRRVGFSLRRARSASRSKSNPAVVRGSGTSPGAMDETATGSANLWSGTFPLQSMEHKRRIGPCIQIFPQIARIPDLPPLRRPHQPSKFPLAASTERE